MKPPANYLKLVRVLNQLFRRQGAELISSASRLLAGNGEIDLDHWNASMAEELQPLLLQDWQGGMIRSIQRISSLNRGNQSPRIPTTPYASSGFTYTGFKSLNRGITRIWSPERVITQARRFPAKALSNKVGVNFDLFNPKVMDAVDKLVLRFCQETNATATGSLNDTLRKLREQLKQGLSQGDAVKTLAARVRTLFTDPSRAFTIAATESSRAMHEGALLAAKQSGVVNKKRWLASSDACNRCLQLANKEVLLDRPFIILPGGGPYARVMCPPLHPHCFCDFTEVLGTPKGSAVVVPQLPPTVAGSTKPEPAKTTTPAAPAVVIGEKAASELSYGHDVWNHKSQKKNIKKLVKELGDKERQKQVEEVRKMGAPLLDKWNTLLAERAKIKQEIFKLDTSLPDYSKKLAELNEQLKQKDKEEREAGNIYTDSMSEANRPNLLASIIAPKDPIQVIAKVEQTPRAAVVAPRAEKVAKFLSKVMGKSGTHKESGFSFPVKIIPPSAPQRAFCNYQTGVNVTATEKEDVIIHEVGHWIEMNYPKVRERLHAFWAHRCGKETPINMKQTFGNGYSAHEVGYKDDFEKLWGGDKNYACYNGKKYDASGDTELLSMGLEKLWTNPKIFAKEDPEYFALIIGILKGEFR